MSLNLPDIDFINRIKDDIKRKIEDKINDVRYWVELAKQAVELAKQTIIRQITDTVGALYYSLKNEFNYVRDSITNNVNAFINTVKNELQNRVQDVKNNLIDYYYALKGKIEDVKNSIVDNYNNIKNKVISEFNTFRSIFSTSLSIVKTGIENKLYEIEGRVTKFVTETWNNVKTTVTNAISDAKREITDTLNIVKGALKEGLEQAKREFGDKLEIVKNALQDGYEQFKIEVKKYYDIIKGAIQSGIEQAKRENDAIRERITSWLKETQDRIIGKVTSVVKDIETALLTTIAKVTADATKASQTIVSSTVIISVYLNDIITKIVENKYNNFDEIKLDIDKIGGVGGIVEVITKFFIAYGVINNVVPMVAQPFIDNIVNLANVEAQNQLLTPPVISNIIFRGVNTNIDFDNEFRKLGFNSDRQKLMIENERPLLEPFHIQSSYLRGDIEESTHDILLKKHGYTDDQLITIKKLYNIIPPVSDIITMSVREVFSPEIAEKFGQFEDFPVDFAKYAKMQGLSEQWAKNYWAAHWGLPSAGQGFEMLQRRIIDYDSLKLLLKSLDVMPFWRDKLIQLSYNPYTRVDIRRMNKIGVLDEQGVYEAYLDVGYNEERAKKLTEFTILLNTADTAGDLSKLRKTIIDTLTEAYIFELISKEEASVRLTMLGLTYDDIEFTLGFNSAAKIIKSIVKVNQSVEKKYSKIVYDSYARRAITKNDAVEDLIKFGIDELEVASELELIDYEIERNIKDKMIVSVQELYTEYTIDKPKMYSLLSDFGFTDSEIRQTFKELDILREMRTKKPTKNEFVVWLKQGLIDMERFILELKGLGFADTYIELYTQSLESYSEE